MLQGKVSFPFAIFRSLELACDLDSPLSKASKRRVGCSAPTSQSKLTTTRTTVSQGSGMGKSPGLTLQASIVQDNVPVEVAPRVFVGSMHAAFNVDALKEKSISHIVNLTGNYATFPNDFTYLSISIRDKEYANLLSCLPVALLFIEAALSGSIDEERGVLIHCAGGRSRSPAVITAYLMTKYHMSFDEAMARIRSARPVVSLNAGFEAQLRCLEKADGDVFAAQQLMLQQKLTAIVQQREDGMLDMESSQMKSASRHPSRLRVPRTPRADDSAYGGIDPLAACDDRGMLHGMVPSGCSLSLPEDASKRQHFIPTLRSMGALFGCRACGENLFCASSVIDQCQSKHRHPVPEITTTEIKTKRPLLAKLRLRPHSPSVKGVPQTAIAVGASKSNPTTPRLAVLKSVIKTVEKQQELPKPGSTSDLDQNLRAKDDLSRTHSGGFWRSLTSFKSSAKRAGNEAEDDKKKKAVVSPKAIAIDLSTDAEEEQFLQENSRLWERKLSQLERSWGGRSSSTGTKAFTGAKVLSSQLSELIARDSTMVPMLEGPQRLCIAPLPWLLRSNVESEKGTIVCPNEHCRAVLGQWQWEGIRCTCGCGHVVLPVFALDKGALRAFGNVVDAPIVAGETAAYTDSVLSAPLSFQRRGHNEIY